MLTIISDKYIGMLEQKIASLEAELLRQREFHASEMARAHEDIRRLTDSVATASGHTAPFREPSAPAKVRKTAYQLQRELAQPLDYDPDKKLN